MPILDVDRAASVIVLKRAMTAASPASTTRSFTRRTRSMLFGDAKTSVMEVTEELKAL